MKKLFFTTLSFLLFTSSYGQAFELGNNNISLGYGAGNFSQEIMRDIVDYDEDRTNSFESLGPLFVKYEYAIDKKVGLGVNFAYLKNTINYLRDTDTEASVSRMTYSILARVNFHMGNSDVIDPYVGIGAGFRQVDWTYKDNDNNPDNDNVDQFEISNFFPLGLDLTIGMRAYPVEEVGLFFEVGIAKGIIQGGLTFNL